MTRTPIYGIGFWYCHVLITVFLAVVADGFLSSLLTTIIKKEHQ